MSMVVVVTAIRYPPGRRELDGNRGVTTFRTPRDASLARPPNSLGGSEIDHVLFKSPTMHLLYYSVGADGLWLGISDHRPVICSFPLAGETFSSKKTGSTNPKATGWPTLT